MVFAGMAHFMVTRSTSQSKSHHQKMLKRHGDLELIIRHIEKKFGKSVAAKIRKHTKPTCQQPSASPGTDLSA
jgi:hypothetical protein